MELGSGARDKLGSRFACSEALQVKATLLDKTALEGGLRKKLRDEFSYDRYEGLSHGQSQPWGPGATGCSSSI